MKLIMENWRKFISEATEDEASHIKDAMDAPIEDYPFGDIFGNSYRKIMKYKTIDPETNFGNAVDLLKRFGWKVNIIKDEVVKNKRVKRKTGKKVKVGDQEFDETETVTVMSADGKPERVTSEIVRFTVSKPIEKVSRYMKDGKEIVRVGTKVETFKPASLFNKMIEFTTKLGEQAKKERELNVEIGVLEDKYEEVYEAPKNERTKEELEKLDSVLKQKNKEAIKISNYTYSGFAKYFGGGDYANHNIEDAFLTNEDSFIKKINKARDYFNDGTRMEKLSKNYEDFLQTQYFILSRHPMDVFRMSDHAEIGSCHNLPNEKGKDSYDEYNICALSEVYGNGMIVYSVPAKEFVRAGIPPTQESLDEMGGEEIFFDVDRNVAGLEPDSRIRIKNVAFHDPENKEEPISIASPQGKIYGKETPDFDTYIYKKLADMQKTKIESIISKFPSGEIDMSSFTRYGGSYEDAKYHVDDVLPNLFSEINPDLDFHGGALYDKEMENTIMMSRGISETDRLRLEADALVASLAANTGNLITFEIVVDEDSYSGEPMIRNFEMYCQFNLVGQLVNSDVGKNSFDLREELSIDEVIGELAENGDLSGNWETVSYDEVEAVDLEFVGDNRYTGVVRYRQGACEEIFGEAINSIFIEQISAAITKVLPYLKEIYDRISGSVNMKIEKHLKKDGIFVSEDYILDIILKKYGILDGTTDLWWDEEKIKKEEDDEGEEYTSSARFSTIMDFNLQNMATDMLGEDTSAEEVIVKFPKQIKKISSLLANAFNQYFMNEKLKKAFVYSLLEKKLPAITIDYDELSYDEAYRLVTVDNDTLAVPVYIKLENEFPANLKAGVDLIENVSPEMMEDKVLEAIHGFLKNQAGSLSENKRRMKVKIIRG